MPQSGISRSLLVFCSVLSPIVGGVIGYFTPHPKGLPITVITPDSTPMPTSTPTPTPLRVYVSGVVQNPAVYRLPPGSLVEKPSGPPGALPLMLTSTGSIWHMNFWTSSRFTFPIGP